MATSFRDRELLLLGEKWEAVVAVDMRLVRKLFSMADPIELWRAHKAIDPCRSWDILVGEHSVSLWLDDLRLSEVTR